MKSLGMIETHDLIAAIEAADVMLKVANVTLLGVEKVRGGLVTTSVEGDVGAVKTAVEAATSAVNHLGQSFLCSSHHIPRPDDQLTGMYSKKEKTFKPPSSEINDDQSLEQELLVTGDLMDQVSFEKQMPKGSSQELSVAPPVLNFKDYKKQLEKTRAADLRVLLMTHQEVTMTAEQVNKLVRREMIAILLDAFKRKDSSND